MVILFLFLGFADLRLIMFGDFTLFLEFGLCFPVVVRQMLATLCYRLISSFERCSP